VSSFFDLLRRSDEARTKHKLTASRRGRLDVHVWRERTSRYARDELPNYKNSRRCSTVFVWPIQWFFRTAQSLADGADRIAAKVALRAGLRVVSVAMAQADTSGTLIRPSLSRVSAVTCDSGVHV